MASALSLPVIPDTIYAARKDSPLILALSDNGNFIASDIPAVLKYTNRYCRIDEGELAIVTPSDITVLSRDGKPVEKKIETAVGMSKRPKRAAIRTS